MDMTFATSLFLLAAGASAFLHADGRALRSVGLLLVVGSLALGWGRPSALVWQVGVLIAANGLLPLWVGARELMGSVMPRLASRAG